MDNSRKNFITYIAVLVLWGLAAGGVHPVTPTMIIERGLDSSMFGVAFAAMQFTMFLFSPFFGRLCNYVPTRRIIFWGGVGYTLSQTVFLFSYTNATIIVARMMAGISCAAMQTAMPNYAINTAPDEETRKKRITIYQTTFNVSTAAGYFTGGMLGLISVEAAIIAQVIMLAASAVLFRFICLDDTPFKVRPDHALRLKDANPFGAFIELRHFITVTLVLLFVIIAATSFGQYALEQSFNYAIKDVFNLSSAYNGIFKAIIALTSLVLNSTLCIWMIRKTDINVSILPIVLGGLIPMGLLLGMETVVPFAAMDILFFIFNAIRLPLLQNLCVANATPETRNNIIGFYQSMTSFGAIFGAFLAGVLYPSGPKKPFVMAFAVFAVGTLVTVLYVVRYKMQKKNRR